MSSVGYVCIEESFDTIFNMGCGGGALPDLKMTQTGCLFNLSFEGGRDCDFLWGGGLIIFTFFLTYNVNKISFLGYILYVQEVVTQPKIMNQTILSNLIHVT